MCIIWQRPFLLLSDIGEHKPNYHVRKSNMAEPHKSPTVEDEADGVAAEDNEEDWEDEESEEEEDAEDEDGDDDDEEDEDIDHEDVHELAMKTNALLV
jgi:hypothetical protein